VRAAESAPPVDPLRDLDARLAAAEAGLEGDLDDATICALDLDALAPSVPADHPKRGDLEYLRTACTIASRGDDRDDVALLERFIAAWPAHPRTTDARYALLHRQLPDRDPRTAAADFADFAARYADDPRASEARRWAIVLAARAGDEARARELAATLSPSERAWVEIITTPPKGRAAAAKARLPALRSARDRLFLGLAEAVVAEAAWRRACPRSDLFAGCVRVEALRRETCVDAPTRVRLRPRRRADAREAEALRERALADLRSVEPPAPWRAHHADALARLRLQASDLDLEAALVDVPPLKARDLAPPSDVQATGQKQAMAVLRDWLQRRLKASRELQALYDELARGASESVKVELYARAALSLERLSRDIEALPLAANLKTDDERRVYCNATRAALDSNDARLRQLLTGCSAHADAPGVAPATARYCREHPLVVAAEAGPAD
jgi:hypothetical protein